MTDRTVLPEDDLAALKGVIADYEKCWNARDYQALRKLWDPEDPNPVYIAEEVEQAMLDWDTIEAYWQGNQDMISDISLRSWDHRFKRVTDDVATAVFWMHWNARMKGADSHPMGGDVKVTATLRKTGDGWRFVHYAESMLGPLPFLRKIYGRMADPDFVR